MTQMMFTKCFRLTVAASVLTCSMLMAADEKPATPAAKPAKKPGTKWDSMEHGPFLSSHLDTQPRINKAVSINLGNGATVAFDTEMCKLALGWMDGFVRLPTGRDGLEGMPKPDSTNIIFTTPAGPGWANADGNFTDGRPEFKGKKYGPLPKEHAKWKGIYLDGDKAVLSYTVGDDRNGAGVVERHSFDPASSSFIRSITVTKSQRKLAAPIPASTGL